MSYRRGYLVWVHAVLFSVKVFSLSYKFASYTELDEKDCVPGNMTFSTEQVSSKSSCVQLCIEAYTNCTSIFYSSDDAYCHGCSESYFGKDTAALGTLSGSTYYGESKTT